MATIAIAAAAVQCLPVIAYADSPAPVVDTLGLPSVSSQGATCRLSTSELYANWLTATVESKPAGQIDFTWHAAARAAVSSVDACVKGIMVTSRLTDATTVPDCPPLVQSNVATAVSEEALTYQSSGASDYEVNSAVDFPVAYFGGPGTAQSLDDAVVSRAHLSDGSSPDLGSQSLKCYRVRSTVTEYDTAYYENSQRQFVPFCSQQVSYEFVSTPAGPEQVGDPIVDSITC